MSVSVLKGEISEGMSMTKAEETLILGSDIPVLRPRRKVHIGGRIKTLLNYLSPSSTELYDTPTLSVHPGPEVTSGENVSFYCRLGTATNKFFLLKEGRSPHPQHRYGNTQVEFPIGPVTTAHRGTYRCFGSYNNHAWSFPSEPVKLQVTGEETLRFPPRPLQNPK